MRIDWAKGVSGFLAVVLCAVLAAAPEARAQSSSSPTDTAAPPASTAPVNTPAAMDGPGAEPTAEGAPPLEPGAADVAADLLPRDLSPWGMFMEADWVVKVVMIGLAFASVVTWTVWLVKTLELAACKRRTKATLRCLQDATTLAAAVTSTVPRGGAAAALIQAANHEFGLSTGLDPAGIKERIASVFERIVHAAGRQAGIGIGLLATIGATAPFVGLFGTVWGIMNSFIGISEAQTTNLAVVAPGIAEALLATAIGLGAAIPAVIIYNHFTRQIAAYRALLGDAAAGVMQLVSRDLDRGRSPDRWRDAAE